ncbi:hypothetical protein Hanom_Chr00s057544g01783591 [Helianthus anomalus]
MRVRRRFRSRRISEVLNVFEAADGLLLLASLLPEDVAGDENVRGVGRSELVRNPVRSPFAEGVTRLSAYVVTRVFLAGRRGSCFIVYQRCRRGPCSVPPAEIPAGDHAVAPIAVGEKGSNPWIVDPRPFSEYGEVLHTPLGKANENGIVLMCERKSGLWTGLVPVRPFMRLTMFYHIVFARTKRNYMQFVINSKICKDNLCINKARGRWIQSEIIRINTLPV